MWPQHDADCGDHEELAKLPSEVCMFECLFVCLLGDTERQAPFVV